MLATTALSLFFLFWSTLFLVDFYLRSIHFAKYLDFVERHGLSISPFQIRFYINRVDHSSSSLSSSGLTSSLQAWTSRSKRTLRFTATWFSIGALVGLVCFVVTPVYLSWLLLIELSNGFTWLKWHQLTPTAPSMPWLFPGATATPKTNRDDDAFNAALASLNQQQPDANSLFYVPYQEHVQSGITPIIPGVNIPWSHLPLFMLVLVVAGVFHEFGHAVAALNANVRLNGFGVFLFAMYPGAFTEIESEELGRSTCAQKMRIFSAGIWHNIILALIGVLILWSAPTCLLPFYGTGAGVLVSDVNSKSGLSGATGLQPGHIVTRINQCQVHNASEWTKCLEDLHEKQKTISSAAPPSGSPLGYLVQYSKVLPWTASRDKVSSAAGNGEIQCCSEFENVTLSSHICFRYKTAAGDQELTPLEDYSKRETGNEKEHTTTSTLPPPTTLAVNLAESLGVLKNRAKRANVKMKSLPSQPTNQILPSNPAKQFSPTKFKSNASGQSAIQEHDTPSWKRGREVYSHACLPARQVTDHASCELLDHSGALKAMPADYVCVVPALYNGTVLLRFELKNKTRPVLFIGFLSEPLYMIDLLDLTPRSEWFPFFIPQAVELFGKYLVTFSLAMGLLNAVPCYGLDGQFMCSTVVDYFAGRRSPNQRLKLTNSIVAFGTTIFTLNVAIGFSKFLYNYWK